MSSAQLLHCQTDASTSVSAWQGSCTYLTSDRQSMASSATQQCATCETSSRAMMGTTGFACFMRQCTGTFVDLLWTNDMLCYADGVKGQTNVCKDC